MIPWQIKDRFWPPRKFCEYCGCPMEEITLSWNKKFNTTTGKGTVKKRKAMQCLKCEEKGFRLYGSYEYDIVYEFGPTWIEEIRSECE
jgi:hypothetical protein